MLADKYRLVRPIGAGGMGMVWAAINEATSREVAVKLILGSTPDLRRRLMREARACGALKHPNVIDLYDVAQTETGEPFLVMELLEGETLSQVLKHKRRLDQREAASVALDVARALEAAHALGIVHRDLKPANVFMHMPVGKANPVVKVLDFGVAKNLGADDGVRTVLGGLVGSPSYMSPEQARAARDIDSRADIWSLGVVLFQMLTGVRPFSGEEAEILKKIAQGPIPTVAELVRGVDPRMNDVVVGCLKRDRDERFGSATEVIRLLEPLVSSAGAGAAPAAPRPPMGSRPEVLLAGPPAPPDDDSLEETLRFEPRMMAPGARPAAPPAPPPPPSIREDRFVDSAGPHEGGSSNESAAPAAMPRSVTDVVGAPRSGPWQAGADISSTGDVPQRSSQGPSGPPAPQHYVRPPAPSYPQFGPADMTPHGTIIIGQGDAARLRPPEPSPRPAPLLSTAPVVQSSRDSGSDSSSERLVPSMAMSNPAFPIAVTPANQWLWKALAGAGAMTGLLCAAGIAIYVLARSPSGASDPEQGAAPVSPPVMQPEQQKEQAPAPVVPEPTAPPSAPEPIAPAPSASVTASSPPTDAPPTPVAPPAATTAPKPPAPPPVVPAAAQPGTRMPGPMPGTVKVPASSPKGPSGPPKKPCEGKRFLAWEQCMKALKGR